MAILHKRDDATPPQPISGKLPVFYMNIPKFLGREYQVTDEAKTNQFYKVELRNHHPYLRFYSGASNDAKFGTADFNSTRRIDMVIHDVSVFIKIVGGTNTCQFPYTSPTLGRELTWHSPVGLATGDFVCVDENKMPLARFIQGAGVRKMGKIEFVDERTFEQKTIDEFIVVALAVVHYSGL